MPSTAKAKRNQANWREIRKNRKESKRLAAIIEEMEAELEQAAEERRALKRQKRLDAKEHIDVPEDADAEGDGDGDVNAGAQAKRCSRCRSWKSVDKFSVKKVGTGELYAACTACLRALGRC